MAKTKEIVFHRPNSRNYLPPAELPGIDRVMFAKMLGVWLQDDLGFRKHRLCYAHLQSAYLPPHTVEETRITDCSNAKQCLAQLV